LIHLMKTETILHGYRWLSTTKSPFSSVDESLRTPSRDAPSCGFLGRTAFGLQRLTLLEALRNNWKVREWANGRDVLVLRA
jgi:hypothetical protein